MINRSKFIKRLIHGGTIDSNQIFGENRMFDEIMLLCDLLDHFNFGHTKIKCDESANDGIKFTFTYDSSELKILNGMYKYLSVNDTVTYRDTIYSLTTITNKNNIIVTIIKEVV